MRIVVSGSSGFVGSALCAMLTAQEHQVIKMVRERGSAPNTIYWNWENGTIDAEKFENADAVVHLAGESIAARRWSESQKSLIMRSRVEGTRLIGRTLQQLKQPPRVFLSASAVGCYGDRGSEKLTEDSIPGNGFLSEVCTAWEAAAQDTCPHQSRLVIMRIGVVLGRDGGALSKMLLPFQLGVGGRVGTGRQFVSWVGLQDACRAILFCITENAMRGPVNIAGPTAVTNGEFTKTLARVLHRPCRLPMPAAIIRLIFGQLGEEALLAGNRALPRQLQENGFSFSHPTVEEALRAVL